MYKIIIDVVGPRQFVQFVE